MSDQDFTSFISEVRTAIQEIREDVRRIENDLIDSKQSTGKRKWYNWFS